MQEMLKVAVERGASDIHIKAGDFICARIRGDLQPLTQQRLSTEQVKGITLSLIPHGEDKENFDQPLDCIRDSERIDDITDLIAEGRDHYGYQTFDQHLMDLVQTDVVDFDLKIRLFSDPKASEGGRGNLQDEMTQMYEG